MIIGTININNEKGFKVDSTKELVEILDRFFSKIVGYYTGEYYIGQIDNGGNIDKRTLKALYNAGYYTRVSPDNDLGIFYTKR
jgi:hypothetical protein